ncbi:DUF2339 domain-containing protein [Nocardia sp. XZ_19_369]|uniref:DUF2339 domain-containing protein n=1 Tax=Nocardia sp. XZ_19_369 TaxID=2769487 RepID=UPI001E48635C|nr:DUF2339 domain-containing protein [Nocardia sp. XZ_19_369]
MTTSIDPALISRISGEFSALGAQMGVLGRDLELLRTQVVGGPAGAQQVSGEGVSEAGAGDQGSAAPGSGAPAGAGDRAAAAPGSGAPGSAAPVETTWPMHPIPPGAVPPGSMVPPGYVPRFAPAPAGAVSGWVGPQGGMMPPNVAAQGQMPGARGPMPPRGPVPPMGAPMPPGMRPPPPRSGPRAPHTPWWQRDGVISRLLAVAGVAVTLIGVVMLLVLAAQAGFFGPVPRVIAGAVFSVALVAAGMRVFGRVGGRVGGIALAATGIAGAYLDVVAVTAIYHWLHPVIGFAVAFGVAAVGVAVAMRWQSQPLAVLVVVGAAVLSPVLTTELALLAFLIVLQFACVPVQLVRDWPYLHVVRTLPAALATFLFVAGAILGGPAEGERPLLLLAAVAVALVGLAGTIVVVRRKPTDLTASLMFAVATVPMLVVPGMYEAERPVAATIAGVFAAVLLAVGATTLVPKVAAVAKIPGHTAVVAAVAGSIALLETCVSVTDPRTLPTAWFLVALAFLGVAGQRRSGVTAGIGAAFATLGAFAFLNAAGPEILASQHRSEANLSISTVIGAVLALAVVAVAVWCARKLPGLQGTAELQWIAASIAGLYSVTAATVSIGVATGAADGFLIGHSAATILWMAAATAALFYGLRNIGKATAVAKLALGSGLLVTAAALAKLFLFDLATLDGLLRVAAFLAVGVLLLVVGTRYARAFAEAGANSRETGETPTH